MSSFDQATSRRRFLQFLSASPLFAGASRPWREGPCRASGCPIR